MGGVEKYVGFFHLLKERLRESFESPSGESERESNFRLRVRRKLEQVREKTVRRVHVSSSLSQTDFSHISRPKTRVELAQISAAVMGIEFSYAAETAFVSPLLLNLGLRHRHMTLIWMLSPLLGLFITPLLGSWSDGCSSRIGRRRPFILLLSVGIVLGLLLVPNGKIIGQWLGDEYRENDPITANRTLTSNHTSEEPPSEGTGVSPARHPWGILITIVGTVLLDFDADACQSPSRAYMLDVTIPDDHARGLSTFTIMAGLGGSLGYFLGALDWENTFIGELFGGHVRAVFTLVLIFFVACVIVTLRSFAEIPIKNSLPKIPNQGGEGYSKLDDDLLEEKSYGAVEETSFSVSSSLTGGPGTSVQEHQPTFQEYVGTIVRLPRSLQWLCFTNFFSWISLVCYSLYFTDFVGEAVFGGDPIALRGSEERELYEAGVRFGCWGMSLYSLSCSFYSLAIDKLITRFGAKKLYFYGHIVYSVGMVFMGIFRHPVAVIVFSWTAGIMYATLFTMPYLLVARYHAAQTFEVDVDELKVEKGAEVRGLGTDVAIVSSMVFLAQISQSLLLGNVVTLLGSTTAIVFAAALFAACGAFVSSKVLYLDI